MSSPLATQACGEHGDPGASCSGLGLLGSTVPRLGLHIPKRDPFICVEILVLPGRVDAQPWALTAKGSPAQGSSHRPLGGAWGRPLAHLANFDLCIFTSSSGIN